MSADISIKDNMLTLTLLLFLVVKRIIEFPWQQFQYSQEIHQSQRRLFVTAIDWYNQQTLMLVSWTFTWFFKLNCPLFIRYLNMRWGLNFVLLQAWFSFFKDEWIYIINEPNVGIVNWIEIYWSPCDSSLLYWYKIDRWMLFYIRDISSECQHASWITLVSRYSVEAIL